ncbi:MAG: pilus assembly protein TadG-related protein [Verrucomicrobiota bacterium]
MKKSRFLVSIRSQAMILYAMTLSLMVAFMALAIDFGQIYLEDARLSRAADAAVLAGVQNSAAGATNVSTSIRNFSIANYDKLSSLTNVTPVVTLQGMTNALNGQIYTNIVYYYSNTYTTVYGNTATNVMRNTVTVGAKGQVNSATTEIQGNAHTFFLPSQGFSSNFKLRGIAAANRRPRLISLVLDRSGSMLSNGGSANLPMAVTNFLSQFDTNSDFISISSFAISARLDMPMTSNFWTLGTNVMDTNQDTGIQFGGGTGASEGLRMGMETLLYGNTAAWDDPNTIKYLVFFTDGQFNAFRTLAYVPGFTNVIYGQLSSQIGTGTTNTATLPYSSSASDWSSDSGSPQFFSTNVFTTNTSSATTKVVTTNSPGSTLYIMEWENANYTTASLSSMTSVFTNSYSNDFRSIFTNRSDYIPVVKRAVVSHYTNSVVSTSVLTGNQFALYIEPGYTNLDATYNSGNAMDMVMPQCYWPTQVSSAYPQVNFWRKNSGSGGGTYYTNLVQYTPGPTTNTNDATGLTWYHDFTNGFLYYTSTNWNPGYTNSRSTNVLGQYFFQGMSSFSVNGVLYTNSTRYWNGSSWVRTAGIYTNTTTVDPNYTSLGGTNLGLLFTNVIMVSRLDTNTLVESDPQIASFVYSTNTLPGAANPAYTNGVSLAGTNQLRLFIMPMNFSSRPKALFYPGNAYNQWSNAWVSPSVPNLYNNSSAWTTFVEDEADRAAALVCYYARQSNVTVYTVGLGSGINSNVLIQLANDPRYSGYSAIQPQGAYYYAATGAQITNKFKAIAERIRAVISQ